MSAIHSVSGISPANIQGMDLETALMAVQQQRTNLLETELKQQIESVQQKNDQISKLNQLMGSLNAAAAKAPAGAKATDKVDLGGSASEISDAYKAAGMTVPPELQNASEPFLVTLVDGTKIPVDAAGKKEAEDYKDRNWAFRSTDYSGKKGIVSIKDNPVSVTKGDLDAAIQTVKSQIDSLSNTQQMDMLRLQSLSNKRNEAFDVMTNFIKKMQENRSSIIGNMR
jgi:prefoldin subunit 5